jgi:hypothetical protein
MISKVLSILIVGGENSAELYAGQSGTNRGYIPQFVRQLQRVGWQVQVECHAPIDIHVALPLLQRLNLNRFDLILLELGHTQLQHPAVFSDLFQSVAHDSLDFDAHLLSNTDIATNCSQNNRTDLKPIHNTLFSKLLAQSKLLTLRLLASVRRVGRLRDVEAQLTDLFYYLQPYRRRLVMLTPLPHPQPVSNWLRQKGRILFGQQGRQHMIPTFDTATVVGRGDEFFSDQTYGHLSAVAGDLLGQTLFDYIQNNALLPARPELRQRRR